MSTQTNAESKTTDHLNRYLTFQLGNEHYAIPLLQVKEVIEMTEPVPIPHTPNYFKGIINLRGQVISILDLRTKLQMPKVEYSQKTAIIILDLSTDIYIGVIVDRIHSVQAVHQKDIGPAPDRLTGVKEQYLLGVAKNNTGMILLLDLHAALNIEELAHYQKTA